MRDKWNAADSFDANETAKRFVNSFWHRIYAYVILFGKGSWQSLTRPVNITSIKIVNSKTKFKFLIEL